jgi:hypothetical protein
MGIREISLSGMAIAFLLLVQSAAFGQGTVEQQDACKPDVIRLCSNYIPDVDSIVACLKGNKRQLTKPCHDVFFEYLAVIKKSQQKSPRDIR